MLIIFGIRRLNKRMGPIALRCSNCGMSGLALFRVSTWFALFFIPVIPLGFKHVTVCPNCKRQAQVSKETVDAGSRAQRESSWARPRWRRANARGNLGGERQSMGRGGWPRRIGIRFGAAAQCSTSGGRGFSGSPGAAGLVSGPCCWPAAVLGRPAVDEPHGAIELTRQPRRRL